MLRVVTGEWTRWGNRIIDRIELGDMDGGDCTKLNGTIIAKSCMSVKQL